MRIGSNEGNDQMDAMEVSAAQPFKTFSLQSSPLLYVTYFSDL